MVMKTLICRVGMGAVEEGCIQCDGIHASTKIHKHEISPKNPSEQGG